MDAMLLSAGAGRRMLPLTLNTPKPLLRVGDKCLIEHHLARLKVASISSVVINTSYASEKFIQTLGNGSSYGMKISYSHESETPLETGGGVLKALPLLESDPFLVVSADIWTDFPFEMLNLPNDVDGNLLLVDNPIHNSRGDYGLQAGRVQNLDASKSMRSFTYSGISILRKSLFQQERGKTFPLRKIFSDCIKAGQLAGIYYQCTWFDIGTPDRLNSLNQWLQQSSETIDS